MAVTRYLSRKRLTRFLYMYMRMRGQLHSHKPSFSCQPFALIKRHTPNATPYNGKIWW